MLVRDGLSMICKGVVYRLRRCDVPIVRLDDDRFITLWDSRGLKIGERVIVTQIDKYYYVEQERI